MIRHCLQSLHLCPLSDFERLDWNSGLLPRLFRVLAWPHQPTAARLFKAPPEFQGTHLMDILQRLHSGTRAVAPEDMEEAVRLVEFHLLQLAYDVIQSGASSNGQQDSSSGLHLLDQARAMLLAEVAAMEENNRDQADVTFLGEHRLYTRGGRPVMADPASEYTGHSLRFVQETLNRAGPFLGFDGHQPHSGTGDPLSAARELEKMIMDKPRGVVLRKIPARLHREFAHTFELILHCFELVHASWKKDRDDPDLSNRTHAMFLATLYFPTIALSIDTKSAETPLSQVKNNIDHFLRGNWYAPVHTYEGMAERSSTMHARQDEPAKLGNQGTDLMRQAAKMVPAARQCLQNGEPSKCLKRMTSQGKFEGRDGKSMTKHIEELHPSRTPTWRRR